MSGVLSRLYRGETTFNFVGRRWWGFGLSLFLIVVTMLSLFTRGLNLGIDFEGGVAWEVPAASITVEDVTTILESNKIDTADAKVQSLNGSDGPRIRVQVAEQSDATKSAVQGELAAKAKVDVQDVSVSSVSSSWGRSITEKAVRALLIFFVLVSIFIAWRFEWKMALSAILAMAHDVLISVGLYSVTGLAVTPATVIAFLTILGFSLYDTIVVFDKVHDNTAKYSASRVSYADITNVSMNQVLMRSINTSLAAVLPVLTRRFLLPHRCWRYLRRVNPNMRLWPMRSIRGSKWRVLQALARRRFSVSSLPPLKIPSANLFLQVRPLRIRPDHVKSVAVSQQTFPYTFSYGRL